MIITRFYDLRFDLLPSQRWGSSFMVLVGSQQEVLQHAEWIGGSGQALALVKNNDLFYKVSHTTLCLSKVNLFLAQFSLQILYQWWPIAYVQCIYMSLISIFQASPDFASVERITDTGVPGVVFNGVSDWLYSGMWAQNPEYHLKEKLWSEISFVRNELCMLPFQTWWTSTFQKWFITIIMTLSAEKFSKQILDLVKAIN